jgi:hypothetical protein
MNVLQSHFAITENLFSHRAGLHKRIRTVKYALYVETHDFIPPVLLRNLVKWCTPCSTGIIDEDMELGLLCFERVSECITPSFAL